MTLKQGVVVSIENLPGVVTGSFRVKQSGPLRRNVGKKGGSAKSGMASCTLGLNRQRCDGKSMVRESEVAKPKARRAGEWETEDCRKVNDVP